MMNLYKCRTCGTIQYQMPCVEAECICGHRAKMQKLTPHESNEYWRHVKSMSYAEVNGNCRADELGHFKPA